MSVEIKKLDVSSIIPTQPPGPTGSYYYSLDIPATTEDGYIFSRDDTNWSNARNASTGYSSSASVSPGVYYGMGAEESTSKPSRYQVYRSFLYFDMSAVPAGVTVLSGILRIHTYDYATNVPPNQWADSDVVALEGTQSSELTTADFDAFTGSTFGQVTWKKYNVNYIEFNQTGIDYLNAQIGSEAKICLREYEHDFMDLAPDLDTRFMNGIFYRQAETYDFWSGNSVYHREYIPFLHLYYRYDWEDTNPGSTTGSKWMYALDGPTAWKSTDWNHDLRIANMPSAYTTWSVARDGSTASSITYGDNASMRVEIRTTSGGAIEYRVRRCYIAFDLAEITDNYEIATAQIRIRSRGFTTEDSTPKLDVSQGTWDYTLTTGEYGSFIDSSLLTAPVTWAAAEGYITGSLNQDGLDYLNNNAGKIVYFCLREYDHDVLDVAPAAAYDQTYYGSFYGTGQGADATYDPALYVTYTT